jgi:hypothetical protein
MWKALLSTFFQALLHQWFLETKTIPWKNPSEDNRHSNRQSNMKQSECKTGVVTKHPMPHIMYSAYNRSYKSCNDNYLTALGRVEINFMYV